MTQQKAFTPQVTCSTIASNKRGYAVTYPSGIKHRTTSFDIFPEILWSYIITDTILRLQIHYYNIRRKLRFKQKN